MIKTKQQIQDEILNKSALDAQAAAAAVKLLTEQMLNDQLYDAVLNNKNAEVKIDLTDPKLSEFTKMLDQQTKDKILSDHSAEIQKSGWSIGKGDPGTIVVDPAVAVADIGGEIDIKP